MLKKIKSFLEENNFDYFLQPNSDEYFSEYLPFDKRRIEFLTGFNGSNATIIFGKKKSFFFTDGRYILQAKQQIDLNEFEIIDIADKSLISWIKDNISPQQNLAIDAKLVSKYFVDLCRKFLPKIILLEKNPIDEIWSDRLKTQPSQPFFCSINCSGVAAQDKITQILKKFDNDVLFISKPENLCWLINLRANDIEYSPIFLAQAMLFKNGQLVIFGDKNRLENMLLASDLAEQITIVSKENIKIYFQQIATQNLSMQIDEKNCSAWLCDIFDKNSIKYFHKNCPIELAKSIKNPHEIRGAIESHRLDGIACTKFLFWLDKSIKSAQIIDEIMAQNKLLEFRKNHQNFLYPSFATISGFAENGAVIHYHSSIKTNQKFTKNSLYLVDSGGQYFGADFMGTTDITRTIAIGTPSSQMIEDYTRVLKGHIAVARVRFPKGSSGSQLDVLARFHIWMAGEDYQHGTGHGVGSFLSVHEGPCAINKSSQQELKAGMILSNEPGIYRENQYGIRLENLFLIEEFNEKFLCFRALSLVPFDFKLIDFSMLTYPEKKWLREYHQTILDNIRSDFSGEELDWFEKNFIKNF